MAITSSLFFKSLVDVRDAPRGKPTFAMIGRSNVGKSSLINALLHRKHLARTSAVPGKTQLINYFLINEQWFLVDLPGYGWAKVSKTDRLRWKKMVTKYLSQAGLETIFVLIDSRHPLQVVDLSFIAWLNEAALPYAIVLTKADKCKPKAIDAHMQQLERTFLERMWKLPPFFVTSAKEKNRRSDGCAQLLKYIERRVAEYSS